MPILDGYVSSLPLCGACENYADPRAWHIHPITKESVMLCDGCVCWQPFNTPECREKIDKAIIEIEKTRAMVKVIES